MFHTIAPVHGVPDHVQYRVNVDGTKTLLEAFKDVSVAGCVKKPVYTSSTGVVWNVRDFNGVSEDQVQLPVRGYDSYHHTKGIAEKLILAEDGKGLLVVVLRPCGMLG